MTSPARILKHKLFLLIINLFVTVVRLQACVHRAHQGAVVCYFNVGVCVRDSRRALLARYASRLCILAEYPLKYHFEEKKTDVMVHGRPRNFWSNATLFKSHLLWVRVPSCSTFTHIPRTYTRFLCIPQHRIH